MLQQRKQIVLKLAEEMSYLLREEYVGRRMRVLVESEEKHRKGVFSGHTENFLPVLLTAPHLKSNDLVDVELYANTPEDLSEKYLHEN